MRSIHETILLSGATLVAASLLAPAASAQVASALIREGDTLVGAPAGHVVTTGLFEVSGNTIGGFAVGLSSSDGSTTLSHIWGSFDGSSPTVLRTEGTYDNIAQTSFETWFGISNTMEVSYSPLGTDLLTGTTSVDCVFVDDVGVVKEGYPIMSLPGKVWRFGSRPDITAGGEPVWVAGINDGTSGANEGEGLFRGAGHTVVVKTGDVIAGMTGTVISVDFDYRFSALGTHWIDVLDNATTGNNSHLVIDGMVVDAFGTPVVEGQPVPALSGGIGGENWDNFDYLGINEAGDYMFTGDTDGSTATDEFLAKNGVILYREGDTVDGLVLTGSIEDARMDENGNVAWVMDTVGPSGSLDTAFFNGTAILRQGDAVDLDGDGIIEPTSLISDIDVLWIASDGTLYLTADVDTMGTSSTTDDTQALFEIPPACPAPTTYCTPKITSTGCVPAIGFSGTPAPGGAFTATCDQVLPDVLGLLVYSTAGDNGGGMPFFGGFLCVTPPATRLPVQNSGGSGPCTGMFVTNLDALVSSLAPGTDVWTQYWFRDPGDMDGVGLSEGMMFTVCP